MTWLWLLTALPGLASALRSRHRTLLDRVLERIPAPRFKLRARPRTALGRRTDRGPAPVKSPAQGAGPHPRENRLAAIPLAGLAAPHPGAHVMPRGWEEDPVRVTRRGDTGEIDMRWDPGTPFPMARKYARKAGYR